MSEQVYQHVRHRLVGVPSQVMAVLRNAERRGALVQVSDPRPLTGERVEVSMVLRERRAVDVPTWTPPRVKRSRARVLRLAAPWYRQVHIWLKGAAVALALAALVGLAYSAYLAVLWVMAHLAVIIGTALLLMVVGGLVAGKAARSGGLHCSGCR